MSTNLHTTQPGLVLPNFARNKTVVSLAPAVLSTPIIPLTPPRLPNVPAKVIATPPKSMLMVSSPVQSPRLITAQISSPVQSPRLITPQISSPVQSPRLTPHQVSGPIITSSVPDLQVPRLKTPGLRSPRLTSPGRINVLNNEDDPWLPPKSDKDSAIIKIAAMTPIGTIAMVPTSDVRPPPTPRKLPMQPPTPNKTVRLKIIEDKDPIVNATIYLDLDNTNDYNHVAGHMRNISSITSNLQKRYATQYKPLHNIRGKVTSIYFEELLGIYENNQVFYQDRLDDKTMELSVIKQGLTDLEHWFMHIIEPIASDDVEAWREREQMKLKRGYSAYCDPELHKYITPLPVLLRDGIARLQ